MSIINQRRVLFVSGLILGTTLQSYVAASNYTSPILNQVRTGVQITGKVTDPYGETLIGATVLEKASGNGTVTDMEGVFTLSVPVDAVIEISYVGYKGVQIAINGKREFQVVLEEDAGKLDEVVVVGYGVQKKVNLSGAVDQVNASQLEQRPLSNLAGSLQGVVPNLNIDFASGEPGQKANINIRGEGSINGGSPLILIDGVPADAAEMNRLLPQDIESLSVLKDASSAAIYGARAAFGVILITTKKGKGDRIQVTYNNNFQWKKPASLTEKTDDPYIYLKLKNIAVLNTPWSSGHVASDERLEWARQRSDNPTGTPSVRLNITDESQWEYMGNTDWTDYFLNKPTFGMSHQLAVSGATERTSFYLSGGIDDENGILSRVVEDDTYKRYSLRGKVSYKLNDWLILSNNSSFVSTERLKPSYYNLSALYDAEPHHVDLNPDGTWANNELGEALAQLVEGGKEKNSYNRIQNTLSVDATLFDRMLSLHANYTFQSGHEDYDWYKNKYRIGYGPDDQREQGNSRVYKANTKSFYNVIDIYANFNKEFERNHIGVVAGFNQEYSKSDYFTAERYNMISSSLPSINLASGEQYVTQKYRDWAIRGLFFRTNYTWDNRYIVELNGRYDGTSRFPKNKRFGFFPSGSVAWRIDSEPFFKSLQEWIPQLKIRASYGSLGNQLVSEYGYTPSMNAALGNYLVDGKLQQTVTSPGLVSADYTWEKVNTLNGGVDLGLFDNRLIWGFDMYRRDTRGMLTQGKELPGVLGKPEPKENAADLKTRGWELSVSYRDQIKLGNKDLQWNAKFTLSDNRSWITKFDNPNRLLNQYYVGQELGEIWGLQSDGLFMNEEEIAALDQTEIIPWGALDIVAGWPRYKDLNGDQRITKGTSVDNPGDLSVIGNSTPRFRYGVQLSASWNGFDASVFLQGIGKRDYYPLSYLYWSFYQQPYTGGQLHVFDFYRAETDNQIEMEKHSQAYINAGLANQNLNAKYPVFQSWLADKNLGTGVNAMGMAIPQTRYLLNGSYLRVKNITVGYTLPEQITRRAKLNRVRVFVSADNLCEFSELKKYFDPEAVTNESSYGYVYPFNRQYAVGVNVTF